MFKVIPYHPALNAYLNSDFHPTKDTFIMGHKIHPLTDCEKNAIKNAFKAIFSTDIREERGRLEAESQTSGRVGSERRTLAQLKDTQIHKWRCSRRLICILRPPPEKSINNPSLIGVAAIFPISESLLRFDTWR